MRVPAHDLIREPPRFIDGPAPAWSLPDRLRAWYRVCRSSDLPAGAVIGWDLPGRSFVLFRGKTDTTVHALGAHCAHMGTHLGQGKVIGDRLRCPLHHWEWDGAGRCREGGCEPEEVLQETYPVVERYGTVFLFNGARPSHPPPVLSGFPEERSLAISGPPVRLGCPWYAVAANAFDIQHLQAVHGRAPRQEPVLSRPDPYHLKLRCASRVTGESPVDRIIRWLSGDCVRVEITCFGGSIIAVESDLGRIRSAVMLCLRPLPGGVEIVPIFGLLKGRIPILDALRIRSARWLYSSYMRKDVAFMVGMRFHPSSGGPPDEVLSGFLEFLGSLPADA